MPSSWMGAGGAAARVLHGSLAAAAAVLASAAVTADLPDKLHLKATPILFYAVPPSMPLPPLPSLSSASFSCFESKSLYISVVQILPKDGAQSLGPLAALPAVSSLGSPSGQSVVSPFSSSFSLAQEAPKVSSFSSTRRALSYLLPECLAWGHPPLLSLPHGFPAPTLTAAPPLHLQPFPFSTASLYIGHTQGSDQRFSSVAYGSDKLNEEKTLSESLNKKPAMTVVLLGWLGAQQKHLKKYAEWYNARGIHAVTFVVPMVDVLNFKVGGKAEEYVDRLADHLALWLTDEGEHAKGVEGNKHLMFHTFSNTGWLTYGVILERLSKQGEHLLDRIKGCVVDSAPVVDPDPQVWASGFLAALLKRGVCVTKPGMEINEGATVQGSNQGSVSNVETEPHGMEAALMPVLEGFFSFFLKLPAINQRLSEVVTILSKQQPPCPQLYIYSTADRVIPVKAVEAFIEQQRKAGRVVRACNLQSSPHVDHFRSHPQLYSDQLSKFLKECLP